MSRALGRWRWPVMGSVGAMLVFLLARTLYGESLGLPANADWFQFFVVGGLGGVAMMLVRQGQTLARLTEAVHGLKAEVSDLRERMTFQERRRWDRADGGAP